MIKYFIVVVCAILSFGCTSTAEQRYSLIEDLDISAAANDVYNVNLDVSGVSDTGGIILQTSDVTVNEALYNRWSIDLETQLTVLLKNILYKQNVNPDYAFDVTVYRFQGSYLGEAQVGALFKVKNKNGDIVLNKDLTEVKDLSADGYSELVTKLKDAWVEVCFKAIGALP